MAQHNKKLVELLYDSLARGDTEAAAALLARDVDWWFHGPRRCQHMRRLLTGEAADEFRFVPRRITEVGEGAGLGWVVAEGWEGEQAYWVHAWAVEGGVITRFREYFNTSVTVREVGRAAATAADVGCGDGDAVWQSQARAQTSRSLPGLVLAI
ncbi:Wound-induced protein 1 [Ananas comosus]|uniref:Wound-induced protein 1 n=1 Tax=Ananas comosus TaxID=4615 RepID=A0A199V8G8_ANACO|nr:Wound-induced protein 1 [Ananas comosus]